MKKKLFVCSVIAIVLSLAAFGTTAYFSYEDNTENIITAGDVKIELLESSEAVGKAEASYKKTVDAMPDTAITKITYIKNIGSKSAWIRVSIDKAIEFAEGISGEPDLSLLSLDFNMENWQEKDGYFYYLKELKSGETTEPLFTTVQFSKDMKNKYQNSKAIIDIKAQATQWVNNGDTVFDAAGWPDGK